MYSSNKDQNIYKFMQIRQKQIYFAINYYKIVNVTLYKENVKL